MNSKKFSEAMNDIDDNYVAEAAAYERKKNGLAWRRMAALAACVCFVAVGALALRQGGTDAPNPEAVQVPNPLVEVSSVEEMEKYLDFDVKTLDKEVAAYIVIVYDEYPEIAQIDYADGSCFRMKYGSEDISGISGGELVESKDISGTEVSYYTLENIDSNKVTYAIWEKDGFSCSYIYTDEAQADAEIEALVK